MPTNSNNHARDAMVSTFGLAFGVVALLVACWIGYDIGKALRGADAEEMKSLKEAVDAAIKDREYFIKKYEYAAHQEDYWHGYYMKASEINETLQRQMEALRITEAGKFAGAQKVIAEHQKTMDWQGRKINELESTITEREKANERLLADCDDIMRRQVVARDLTVSSLTNRVHELEARSQDAAKTIDILRGRPAPDQPLTSPSVDEGAMDNVRLELNFFKQVNADLQKRLGEANGKVSRLRTQLSMKAVDGMGYKVDSLWYKNAVLRGAVATAANQLGEVELHVGEFAYSMIREVKKRLREAIG